MAELSRAKQAGARIDRRGTDRPTACWRCLKALHSEDCKELVCKVDDEYNGSTKCGRCVGLGRACENVGDTLLFLSATRCLFYICLMTDSLLGTCFFGRSSKGLAN